MSHNAQSQAFPEDTNSVYKLNEIFCHSVPDLFWMVHKGHSRSGAWHSVSTVPERTAETGPS